MRAVLRRFVKDERGLETVEYAVILALIVAATVTAITALGTWVINTFNTTTTTLTT